MRCPNCDADNPEGNAFCEACGTQLSRLCPECGTRNSPTARYCGACGAFIGSTQGERKRATIMFADIVGSTELISGLDPEQALERLRPAVEAMCAAVQKYDGTVVRTLGDGVMAAFGVPRAKRVMPCWLAKQHSPCRQHFRCNRESRRFASGCTRVKSCRVC
jgi:class 3 adenylate cyclase